MKVVTSEEMRFLDSKTIELGIPSRLLMERAGLSVVLAMESEIGDLSRYSYTVLCGKGNNGGDGLVVARVLLDYTDSVTVVLISKDLKGDPKENLDVLEKLGAEILVLGEDIDLKSLEAILLGSDVVIDALLGTGIKGEIKEPVRSIVDLVNSTPAYKVCVDIPTGIDSDTGKVMGDAVRCDLTVTFALPKIGHVLYPGREYTGKLKVASIGIPRILIESEDLKRELITFDMVSSLLPSRPQDSNKGTFGKVLVVAGSRTYTGAPVLTAMGALVSGAGLVFSAVPEPFNTVLTTSHPELIAIPLRSKGGVFFKESIEDISDLLEKVDVLVVGPGLTTKEGVFEFLKEILKVEKPVVLDADGLNNISKDLSILKSRKALTVLTPHPGEFARLTGKSVSEVKYNYKLAEDFARENGVILVLKSATTIVTDGEKTFFNTTGNTGLSKGGSGDVLAGMIGSFVAQGLDPLEASIVSVYVHGRTSEVYEFDDAGMTPSKVIENIPKVLKELR